MITEIRPKMIFQAVERKFGDSYVPFKVGIPTSEVGGMTLLESAILTSFVKLFNPASIFEFGTFMGATTMLFSLNTDDNAKIYSLDIDEFMDDSKDYNLKDKKENDDYLRMQANVKGAKYIANASKKFQDKITLIKHDSLTIDIEKMGFANKFDMILIDGGHETHIIEKDTQNALKMLKNDGVIFWHDYKSNVHTDVTDFLSNFCKTQPHRIYHVAHSMICFMAIGSYAKWELEQ